MLTVETEDKERGVTYPAWTVCLDKKLQISSDTVIKDKLNKTIKSDAEQVIIPIAGTQEINTSMHLSARKALRDKKIELLKDDSEVEYKMSDINKKWITLSAEEKADILLPFLETHLMVGEAISLNTEISSSNVKVKEDRSATKDRYMTFAMFNYFGDKLLSKYESSNQEYDYDISDFKWLTGEYGDCQDYDI